MRLKFPDPAFGIVVAALVAIPTTVVDVRAAELEPATIRAWESYIELTEQRIASELGSAQRFLARDFLTNGDASASLDSDRVFIEKLQTRNVEGKKLSIPKGMVHHWLGSVFIPNVELSEVLSWVQDPENSEKHIKSVERASLLYHEGDDFRVFLRLRTKRITTAHYDTEHAIHYEHHGPDRTSSKTMSTRIVQIDAAGTANEREKPEGRDSGYLWRWNSYWRFKQEANGVIVECETVSLSRSVSKAFWWFVKPFVRSVPKDALKDTLLSIRDGLDSSEL